MENLKSIGLKIIVILKKSVSRLLINLIKIARTSANSKQEKFGFAFFMKVFSMFENVY